MVIKIAKPALKQLKQYKWHTFFHMFYIEPVVFILVFSHSLSETKIQPYVANLFMIRTLLESIVPAICGVFVGSWSDHYGRKPLLLISMIGFSCTYAIAAVICKLTQYYPVNPWYYVLAVIPHSILGGNCVFSVAAFCFISDVTNIKIRPYRMISLEAFLSIGLMVGSFLSSYVLAVTSGTFVFAFSGILLLLTTVYISLCVPESLNYNSKSTEIYSNKDPIKCTTPMETLQKPIDNKKDNGQDNKIIDDQNFYEVDLHKNCGENNTLRKNEKLQDEDAVKIKTDGLFSYKHVKDMWLTCFKARPSYDRSIILLVTSAMFLHIFVLDGAMTVFYLFVREKFQWNVREFTFYETTNHVTSVLGAIIGFLIMRKVLNMSVVTLGLIAFLSDIIRSVIQGFAAETWHLYIAIAAGALKALGAPMCRTIISNIVPATDLGKIFSIKNILQSIAPFMAAPLYTIIYKASLTSFPGFFNIISAILYFVAFICLLLVLRFKITDTEHYGQILK